MMPIHSNDCAFDYWRLFVIGFTLQGLVAVTVDESLALKSTRSPGLINLMNEFHDVVSVGYSK